MFPAPGDGADGDGLVFISYSHDDIVWAQRFRVLLKPLIRRKRLHVWDDSQIRVGNKWNPAIGEAIERSRVALLLVSADFLASDYIAEREMPALLDRGVMLAPILVGDCFWSVIPELAAVQWLHDPDRDGPLGLHAGNPAERDRRIHRACERLLTVTPEPALAGAAATSPTAPPPPPVLHPVPAPSRRPPDPAGPPPSSSPRDAPPSSEPGPALPGVPAVADLPEGDVAGALSRVPALPPRYVVREELDGLVGAVVGTATGGAVGLTGEPAGVGLHGIGGIGKSVLAAALASDDRVRRRFPDGVYWVTVGERPDVLALQLDLLSRLGVRPDARTRADATQALRAALVKKRVLLVVDDVWSDDAAQAFRVTGPRGRLLYTSRDQGVVAAAGATAHRVGVLSPAAARALAGEVLGVPAATLPPAADRAFAAVGHVPLAVALLAAAVRGRQEWDPVTAEPAQTDRQLDHATPPSQGAWEDIATELAHDADVYGTHPYATTFRALHIAVGALRADLRAALLGLAMFPPDTAIPIAAIARYWAHTRDQSPEETAADLDRLVAAEVLQRSGDTITFHDLAHEYLILHADALPALHAQLLDTYRELLDEQDEWWTLPIDEPYVWEHLAAHLVGAGNHDALVAMAIDPAYQAKRIARNGPHAGEADLAVAARLLPDEASIAWWRAWLARHAHLLGGRRGSVAQPAQVAGTLLAWLEADVSRPAAVRPVRLAPLLPQRYLAVRGGLRPESSALIRVLAGHTGKVLTVTWSADGSRLATADDEGIVRIWDPASGEPFLRLTSHPSLVLAIAWSPDGTRLATAGTGGTVRIWDPATGKILKQLTGHPGGVHAMAWSPNGTRLATAGTGGTAQIWELADGTTRKRLTGHKGRVMAVAWSPDSARVATAGSDGTVRTWRSTTGEPLLHLAGHRGWVLAVAWSPDGTRLAAAGDGGTAGIWNATTGATLATFTGHPGGVMAAAWLPDATCLATAGSGGTIQIWAPATGATLGQLTGLPDWVPAAAWSPDGTRLATGGDDGTARIWVPATPTAKSADTNGFVTAVAWSSDGSRLATGETGGTARISGPTGITILTGGNESVGAVAWCPDDRHLATTEGGTVSLWAAETGHAVQALQRHTHRIRAVAWSPTRPLLATASDDKTVRLWKFGRARQLASSTARIVATLSGHTDWIHTVTWSPDGRYLASAGDDRTVRIWKPGTGKIAAVFDGHTGAVRATAWSPDSGPLASAGADRTLRLWDPTARTLLVKRRTGHLDAIHSVAWSLDGSHLATADYTGLVMIWNRQLQEVASLQLKPSRCLAWSAPLIAVGQPGRPAILELRDPADLA